MTMMIEIQEADVRVLQWALSMAKPNARWWMEALHTTQAEKDLAVLRMEALNRLEIAVSAARAQERRAAALEKTSTMDPKQFTILRESNAMSCDWYPYCEDRYLPVVRVPFERGGSHLTLKDYVLAAEQHMRQVEHTDLATARARRENNH